MLRTTAAALLRRAASVTGRSGLAEALPATAAASTSSSSSSDSSRWGVAALAAGAAAGVGAVLTPALAEDEAKAMAAEAEVTDGPNDEGETFERPGRLSDPLPRPYASEEAARFANGGAYPPDLTLITKARHDGQNYLMALLLGYRDPPAGVHVREGLYYNPYFPGGAIAMPKMLVDGGTEYDDGTEATEAQQAKDVATFLAWAAEPEADDRKLAGAKWTLVLALVWATALYYKRWKWAPIKSRRIVVDAIN